MSGGGSRGRFALPGRRRRRAPPAPDAAGSAIAGWHAARLAALGTGLGTLSHDLRGVLSPALLAAERLQRHADPAVRRSGDVLVRAVDRAMELLRDQLGPLRLGLPEAANAAVPLRAVIEAAVPAGLVVQHALDTSLAVVADAEFLRPAWVSLFAHLRARGACRATLRLQIAGQDVRLAIEHDGQALQADTEPPADADGEWHLAIARDLLRTCGGSQEIAAGHLTVTLRLA